MATLLHQLRCWGTEAHQSHQHSQYFQLAKVFLPCWFCLSLAEQYATHSRNCSDQRNRNIQIPKLLALSHLLSGERLLSAEKVWEILFSPSPHLACFHIWVVIRMHLQEWLFLWVHLPLLLVCHPLTRKCRVGHHKDSTLHWLDFSRYPGRLPFWIPPLHQAAPLNQQNPPDRVSKRCSLQKLQKVSHANDRGQ